MPEGPTRTPAIGDPVSDGGRAARSVPATARRHSPPAIRRTSQAKELRSAFGSWAEIRQQLKAARRWAFFLDFDGTLVRLRRLPADVRMSSRAKSVLKRLAAHANVVVTVVTGRRLHSVRKLVALNELRYLGVHGGERDSARIALSPESRAALGRAKRSVRRLLLHVAGLWIEDKGLTVAVHYRDARPSGAEYVAEVISRIVNAQGDGLRLLHGSEVWEILPREIPGKVSALRHLLGKAAPDTAVIYLGNDGTDEVAFAALPNQITVQVGRERPSSARFFVRTPAEALKLLQRMEKELP